MVNPMVNPQPRAKVGIQHTWFGASSLKCWSSDNVHVGQINAATNEKSNLDPIEPYLPDIWVFTKLSKWTFENIQTSCASKSTVGCLFGILSKDTQSNI